MPIELSELNPEGDTPFEFKHGDIVVFNVAGEDKWGSAYL